MPGLCGLMVVWAPRLSSTALGPISHIASRPGNGLSSARYRVRWASDESGYVTDAKTSAVIAVRAVGASSGR